MFAFVDMRPLHQCLTRWALALTCTGLTACSDRTPPAASIVPPPPPGLAFSALYSVTPPAGSASMPLPGEQVATLYYATDVETDAGLRHLVLIKRTRPGQDSHADGATLDAVSLRHDGRQWVADAQAQKLTTLGSYGDASVLQGTAEAAKVEQHAVGKGYTGVFLPGYESHGGYGSDSLTGIGVSAGRLRHLGAIQVAFQNEGNCFPEQKAGPGVCFSWKGSLITQAQPDQWSAITVVKQGTESDPDGAVKAVNAVYVWDEAEGGYRQLQR